MARTTLAEIADRVLGLSGADQTEVLISSIDEHLKPSPDKQAGDAP